MASHLGLRCLTMSLLWDARLKWVKHEVFPTEKVYTDKGDIKSLYHGLSLCTVDNPLAKACGLSPCTFVQAEKSCYDY